MADLAARKSASSAVKVSGSGSTGAAKTHHDFVLPDAVTLTRDVRLSEPGDVWIVAARKARTDVEADSGRKQRRDARAGTIPTILIAFVVCLAFLLAPDRATAETGSTISQLDAHDGMITQVDGTFICMGGGTGVDSNGGLMARPGAGLASGNRPTG
jgi:hypothetical protein